VEDWGLREGLVVYRAQNPPSSPNAPQSGRRADGATAVSGIEASTISRAEADTFGLGMQAGDALDPAQSLYGRVVRGAEILTRVSEVTAEMRTKVGPGMRRPRGAPS
jgi:hypothetical protein